jgi:hypothetical protein
MSYVLPSFQYVHVAPPDASTPLAAFSATASAPAHYVGGVARRGSGGWGLPDALRIYPVPRENTV